VIKAILLMYPGIGDSTDSSDGCADLGASCAANKRASRLSLSQVSV
jgi:hypothetical protein